MTRDEWIDRATAQAPKLRDLLREYHPVNRQPGRRPQDWITAPNAELACVNVRRDIRENFEGDPVAKFDAALVARDVSTVMNLLNDAWFGVPESRTCWQIVGFTEAVDLIDDPPDDDEAEEATA